MRVKKIWIWLRRFRHRRGYGVHSPFAFNFITYIIHDKSTYYAYEELEFLRKTYRRRTSSGERFADRKRDSFLFRLTNYAQPANLVEVGPALALVYMSRAKKTPCYLVGREIADTRKTALFLKEQIPHLCYAEGDILEAAHNLLSTLPEIGLLHYTLVQSEKEMEEILELFLNKVSAKSVFVIENIHLPTVKTVWNRLKEDPRTGISFDLYHTGVLFFDKKKLKQHYIVNF